MNRQGYLKVLATLTFLALLFFGFLAISAVDRLRASNAELARKLDRVAEQLAAQQFFATAARPAAAAAGAPAANLEFYDPAATPGDRLIRAISADTPNMNLIINNEATVAAFHGIANSSLAERNYADPDKFEPLMAESWEISPDKLSFRLKLRPGILWHDFTDPVTGEEHRNREVTAHDFKFYVDVIKNPDVNCEAQRNYFQDMEGIEVLNDYEFMVKWRRPYYGSLPITLQLSPLPRHLYHAYEGPFDGKRFNDDYLRNRILIGCGPYRFDRWEKDVRVVFTRNEKFFGAALGIRPPLDTLVFELIKLPNTRFQALLAGQLDQLGLTPEQWTERTGAAPFADGRLVKHKYLGRSYSYIGYNLSNPLFSDKRVRQALTMLIDRERIRREVYQSLAETVTGPFPPESHYVDPELKPWPCDVEGARKLLAEAGWRDTDGDGILDRDGRKFVFSIMQVANHPIQQKMLPMMKEMLAQAGIDMKIETLEWSVVLQRLEQRKFECCTLGWTSPLDPDPYQVWHSSQADLPQSSNFISFRHAEADKLIEELRVTFDTGKRIELARAFGRILHDEQPYTFLFAPYNLSVYSGRYRNIREFPIGIPDNIIWTPTAQQLTFQ